MLPAGRLWESLWVLLQQQVLWHSNWLNGKDSDLVPANPDTATGNLLESRFWICSYVNLWLIHSKCQGLAASTFPQLKNSAVLIVLWSLQVPSQIINFWKRCHCVIAMLVVAGFWGKRRKRQLTHPIVCAEQIFPLVSKHRDKTLPISMNLVSLQSKNKNILL